MSQLEELAVRVLQVAKAMAQMAGNLSQMSQNMDHAVKEVHQTISNEAAGTDQAMISAYEQAKKDIDAASMAMMIAVEAAENWANNAVKK